MTTLAEMYREAFDAEVEDAGKRSPSFSLEDYTATGRATKEYGGKRTAQWWLDHGPAMVEKWIAWREETKWEFLTLDAAPAIEVELDFTLPGDIVIKGYIDRVFVLPTGEVAVVDLKSGRIPETGEQLGLYRVGLGLTHNIWPDWGYYWNPDKGNGQPILLTKYTPDYFAELYGNAIRGINAGAFIPKPANSCRNWCGVARFCAAVGGSEAAGVDPLVNVTFVTQNNQGE